MFTHFPVLRRWTFALRLNIDTRDEFPDNLVPWLKVGDINDSNAFTNWDWPKVDVTFGCVLIRLSVRIFQLHHQNFIRSVFKSDNFANLNFRPWIQRTQSAIVKTRQILIGFSRLDGEPWRTRLLTRFDFNFQLVQFGCATNASHCRALWWKKIEPIRKQDGMALMDEDSCEHERFRAKDFPSSKIDVGAWTKRSTAPSGRLWIHCVDCNGL